MRISLSREGGRLRGHKVREGAGQALEAVGCNDLGVTRGITK